MPVSARWVYLWLVALLLAGTPTSADPRYWWNDRQLTSDGAEKASPDIVWVGDEGSLQGGALFLTWQQRNASGHWEIYLTASVNGGCSFCRPVRLTTSGSDNLRPRIAAARGRQYAVQIVWQRDGDIWLYADASTIPWGTQQSDLCSLLEDLPARMQRQVLNAVPGTASNPDIAVSGPEWNPQFFVAWEDQSEGESDIFVDQDRTGDGLGYGSSGFPMNLTPHDLPSGDAVLPAIEGHLAFADARSAAVIFAEASSGDLLYLRSADGGANWSEDGLPSVFTPVGYPDRLSASGSFDATLGEPPAHITSDLFHGTIRHWSAVAWPGASGDSVRTTAQSWEWTTITNGWQDIGEHALAATPTHPRVGATMTSKGIHLLWSQEVDGFGEIMAHDGWLDVQATEPYDLNRRAHWPRFPEDELLPVEYPLTHCEYDPSDLSCHATRTAGEARDVAATDSHQLPVGGEHITWIDTRSGATEIYYKRSDRAGYGGRPFVMDTSCASPDEVTARVRVWLNEGCLTSPSKPEADIVNLLYYGTDPGGVYENAADPFEFIPDGDVYKEIDIPGLQPETTYYFLVYSVDEAWNQAPPGFDPAIDAPEWAGEISHEMPSCQNCLNQTALHVVRVPDLNTFLSNRPAGYFLVPPPPDDQRLDAAARQCPFAPGDALEEEAGNGLPLTFYGLNRPVRDLRLARDASAGFGAVRFSWTP